MVITVLLLLFVNLGVGSEVEIGTRPNRPYTPLDYGSAEADAAQHIREREARQRNRDRHMAALEEERRIAMEKRDKERQEREQKRHPDMASEAEIGDVAAASDVNVRSIPFVDYALCILFGVAIGYGVRSKFKKEEQAMPLL